MNQQMVVPFRDYILVKPNPKDEMTVSGLLYIPEVAREKTLRGKVVAVGTGKKYGNGKSKAISVSVGDNVYYTKNFTIEVMHNGSEHLLMIEERVLLIEN